MTGAALYRGLHDLARRLAGTRRRYNLLRRVALVGARMLRIPHEQDYGFFRAFPELRGPVLDVGANGGQTIVSLSLYCPRAELISFEPNPALQGELRFARRLCRRRARVLPCALGERDGAATLHIPHNRGLPFDARASLERGDNATSVAVPVAVRAYDGLGADALGTARDPELVKIDVEGTEHLVLQGMRETLRRALPLVLLEHSPALSLCLAELQPLGYELFDYDPAAHRLSPLPAQPRRDNVFALPPAWRAACRARGLLDG